MLNEFHTKKRTMQPRHSPQNNNCSNGMPSGIQVQNYYSGVTVQGNPPGVSRICGLVVNSIQTKTKNNQQQPSINPIQPSTETTTPTTNTPSVVSPPLPPPQPQPEAESPQPFIIVSTSQLQQVFKACVKCCSLCGSENVKLEVQTKNGLEIQLVLPVAIA